jgi:hypothetical protein
LNEPADEEAITETTTNSTYHDSNLEESWAVNPKGFTLIAACEHSETATEQLFDGKYYGAFIYGLLTSLKRSTSAKEVMTYRTLCDRVHLLLSEQTLVIFARDRLIFFRDKELFIL